MIDSITSSTSNVSTPRAQSTSTVSALRNNQTVLNAVVQSGQRASNATAPVTAFAVPQTSKGGNSSSARLPRGSIVDVLA